MSRGRELHRPRASAAAALGEKPVTPGANDIRDADTGNGSAAPASSTKRILPPWGGPLNESDYTLLESSWISGEIADAAMLRRVDTYEGREVVGQKGNRDCAGLLFPYYWPDQPRAFNYRLRRDNPEWIAGKDGKPKPDKKYLGPPNGSNRLYIPPAVTLDQLQDITIPIVIVEGEKKALALSRLAYYETEKPRWIPIGIAGVWNWRGVIAKANGPKGERIDVKGPIADLSRVAWTRRKVHIVFDADVKKNPSVNWARKGIARELATRKAAVDFIDLPEDCGMNGIDDLLAAWGPSRVLELFEKPTPSRQLQVVLPPQFQSRPEGMFRVTTKGEQLVETQLTNFRASVAQSILLDDGVESKREFEIECELLGRPYRFTIPASQFTTMDWPIAQMGPQAIIFPNLREFARTAIQSVSVTLEERCIFTHTGWREVDGRWLYLHHRGSIGGEGAVSNVNVRLSGPVSRYELRIPAGPEKLRTAVKASLRLLDLGPPAISFPLLAATYRPVLGEADFALHLVGETGAFKSELAALHQQHFGAAMNRLNLPGSWSSTGNSLEVLAFHAKDGLFVIDDFAPPGSSVDVARYHAAADRVFRAAGNHAGRGRLDSTAKLRDPKPPRALILSTGEEIPRGQSLRARLLILELSKGAIQGAKLAECQKDAEAGLYAEAMGAYVRFVAAQFKEAHAVFERKVSEHRERALNNMAHARTPDIVANLQAGFEMFLGFCVACEALDAAAAKRLAIGCWEALHNAAIAQSKHQGETEPAARFLTILRSLLNGRAHFASRSGDHPDRAPRSCGWRLDNNGKWMPQGECVGWVDGEDLFLEPIAAYRQVQIAATASGESMAVSEQTLKKRMREKGLLASVDEKHETLTVRRKINGVKMSVLHLLRDVVLPAGEDRNVG